MNKEQQIEEMKKVMCEEYGKECNDCPCADCANSMIAERFYNAGYRKTFTSDLASDTQKAYKEGYRKGFDDGQQEFLIIKQRNFELITEIERMTDKLENGELVSKEWHDEQVLHAESEIAALKEELRRVSEDSKERDEENLSMQSVIDELGKENGRLREAIEDFTVKKCGLRCEIVKTLVKEFAEKLKAKYGKSCSEYFPALIEFTTEQLDELLKEYEK